MSRETKQDRIVRGMLDQVTEHLHELKGIEANPGSKESDVEHWVQGFLKNCLGFMASAGYQIRSQQSKGKYRPDLVIVKDEKPLVLIEVKKLGFNLDKTDFRSGKIQLSEYLQALGNAKWGILTNGVDWKLFDFSDLQNGGVEVVRFSLKEDDQPIDTDKKSVEECCYTLLDMHESSFQSGIWAELSKEATVFSPESLAKAILSYDVIKYVAKVIRGEHEYKANFEILCDRVHLLLEEGLNDAQPGWNETKAIELNKFVKSQKRASRRTRKSKRQAPQEAPMAPAPTIEVSTEASNPETKTDVA
jgi:hypothetical protein